MRALSRRRVLAGLLACGVAAEVTCVRPAEADLFGADVIVLTAILTQAIAQAVSLANLVVQMVNQVKMMTTLLKQVEAGSFPALLSFLNAAVYSVNTLTSNVRAMSYRMGQIDGEFQRLFPSGTPPPGTSVAQHKAQYQAWNQEVVGASQVAARQQTTLSNLDEQVKATKAVLEQSQSASGVVAQLQLITQMIGITNSELTVLNQTLSTTGRVLTDLAALSGSERQLSAGKSDDAREGYTDKGPSVSVPHTMP